LFFEDQVVIAVLSQQLFIVNLTFNKLGLSPNKQLNGKKLKACVMTHIYREKDKLDAEHLGFSPTFFTD